LLCDLEVIILTFVHGVPLTEASDALYCSHVVVLP